MRKNKYFYKGKELKDFCLQEALSIRKFDAAIEDWCRRFPNYKIEEIITTLIETNIESLQYKFKGMALKEYCEKNELEIDKVYNAILKVEKSRIYKDKSEEEIVERGIITKDKTYSRKNRPIKQNYKQQNSNRLMYDNEPMGIYCKRNGLDLTKIKRMLKKKRENEEYASFSDNELIKEIIDNIDYKNVNKHNDSRLIRYCMDNELDFKKLQLKVKYLLNTEIYRGYSYDEIVDLIIENGYRKSNSKYFYNNVSVREYCYKNGLDFRSVSNKIAYLRKKFPKYSDDMIAKLSIEAHPINHHYYKGMLLTEYCKKHGHSYQHILTTIKKIKNSDSYNQESDEELIDRILKYYGQKSRRSMYKGMPLVQYCKENNLDFKKIKAHIYNYSNNEKYKGFSKEQLIDFAIARYALTEDKKRKFLLLNKKNKTQSEIDLVCKDFKIDEESVDKLGEKIGKDRAILVIYYFYDKIDSQENKRISANKVLEIKEMINKAKKGDVDDIYSRDLLRLYKSHLLDTRKLLLIKTNMHLTRVMWETCKKFNVNLNATNKKEFMSILEKHYLDVVDRIQSNEDKEIFAYIDKYISGKLMTYLKKFISENNLKGSYADHEICNIDNKDKIVEEFLSKNLSKNNIALSKGEFNFLILRYKKGYSYDRLTKVYKISENEVKNKENIIISKLLRVKNRK